MSDLRESSVTGATTAIRPAVNSNAVILFSLLLLSTWNYLDRAAVGILQEPIKREFGLSDFQLGLLGGPAFALLYVLMGIPFARLAERVNRVRLIAAVFALWSVMTALCGAATSFAFLLMARAGVSIGEAGCSPSAHSFIADRFAPERRPWALAVFTSGVSLGALIAALAGGAVAQHFGWRPTFFVLGASGLVLALGFLLVVPEAQRGTRVEDTPSFAHALRFISGRPVIWHIALGLMVAALMGFSMTQYMTSYYIRSHGMSIGEATLRVALISGVAGVAGTHLGGYLGNRVAARNLSKASLVGAWGFIVAAPLFAFGFLAPQAAFATMLLMLGTAAQLTYFGPAFAILHATVEPRMRATAVALVLLVTNLFGYGLGPPMVGAASDALAEFLRNDSAAAGICAAANWLRPACEAPNAGGLQWTLSLLAIGNFWAFYHFRRVSRQHGELLGELLKENGVQARFHP